VNLYDGILYFITYSFLGWCCESMYCSIGTWKWINRGFLNGPFCPIYGFGAIITLLVLQDVPKHFLTVFLAGMLFTSILEYITGWGMEKIFHTRWWDYSKKQFNIHGRICLLNSTLFGLLCVTLYFDLHPIVQSFYGLFSLEFKQGFLAAFGIYFLSDLLLSVWSAFGLKLRLQKLDQLKNELLNKYPTLISNLSFQQILKQMNNTGIQNKLADKLQQEKSDIGLFERRLLKAFPELSSERYGAFLDELKGSLNIKKQKIDTDLFDE
jgi:uncharacterized membrane protein